MIDAAFRQVQDLPTAVHGPKTTAARSGRFAAELPFPSNPDAIPGYTIEREISRGGQGVVYEAVQQSTGRRVAIKLLLAGPLASPDDRARFEREVRVLGRLRHPNIVSIHHSDSFGGGYYYVMDYIAGQPLDVFVRSQHLNVRAILRLFATICDALNAAHQRGIIHRDLKPGNVRVDADGVPLLLDFGLSKLADDPDDRSATRTGQFVGSVPWASPEQAAGERDNIDVRSDVYSLGVLLFQMLTDRFPYPVTGRPSKVLDTIQHTPPARPRSLRRDVSEDVETIVLMCLQKERARRYQSAGELAADVRRCLAGEPIEARRDSGWYVLRKHLWRHRLSLGVAAAFVALVLASAVLAWSLYGAAAAARARAEEKSHEATDRLWDSYVAQARAIRSSNRIGRRFEALSVVQQAASIRKSVALRNEAIAAIALSDLRFERDYAIPERASAAGLDTLDRYAAFGNDGRVQVFSVDDGRSLAEFIGPALPAWFAVFSPDGRYLAVKYHEPDSPDVDVRLWDVTTGQAVLSLPPQEGVRVYVFRPDGREFAVATRDGRILVYELPSCRPVRQFTVDLDPYRLAVDPAGKRLAVSSLYAPFLKLIAFDTGAALHTLDAPVSIRGMAVNSDGTQLAGSAADGRVYLWSVASGERIAEFMQHQGEAVESYFDPAERFLVSWGWDNVARFWDPATGQLLLDPAEGWMVNEVRDRIAVFRRPQTLSFVRFEPSIGLEGFGVAREQRWNSCALLGQGRYLLAANSRGLWMWDRVAGGSPKPLRDEWVGNLCSLDDSRVIAIDGVGVMQWKIVPRPDGTQVGEPELLWRQEQLISVGASSSGRFLAARTRDSLLCFDVARRAVAGEFPIHAGLNGTPAVTDDGRWLFAGTWRGDSARVYDTRSREVAFEIPEYQVHGHFSPDDQSLVVSLREEYRVYRVVDWALQRRIPRSPHAAIAGGSAFSPDGRTAALTRTNYDVVLFDLESGREIAELPNRGLAIFGTMTFSTDGGTLAISSDRGLQVWNLNRIRAELAGLGLDWTDGAPLQGESR